jgi:hypothetical protein
MDRSVTIRFFLILLNLEIKICNYMLANILSSILSISAREDNVKERKGWWWYRKGERVSYSMCKTRVRSRVAEQQSFAEG